MNSATIETMPDGVLYASLPVLYGDGILSPGVLVIVIEDDGYHSADSGVLLEVESGYGPLIGWGGHDCEDAVEISGHGRALASSEAWQDFVSRAQVELARRHAGGCQSDAERIASKLGDDGTLGLDREEDDPAGRYEIRRGAGGEYAVTDALSGGVVATYAYLDRAEARRSRLQSRLDCTCLWTGGLSYNPTCPQHSPWTERRTKGKPDEPPTKESTMEIRDAHEIRETRMKEWFIEQSLTRAELGYVRAETEKRARQLAAAAIRDESASRIWLKRNPWFRLLERIGDRQGAETVILY